MVRCLALLATLVATLFATAITSRAVEATNAVRDPSHKCHMHLIESHDCYNYNQETNLYVDVTVIAGTETLGRANKMAGAKYALRLNLGRGHDIVITPEHQNDYIQFEYDQQWWASNDPKGLFWPYCEVGGWDSGACYWGNGAHWNVRYNTLALFT